MKLVGGDINEVFKIEDTVRRPAGEWTPAVHALLGHFERVGFEGAPRALGFDDEGREVLSFVEGEPGHAPVPCDDAVLVALARLLRRMHDAQAGFEPPADARWQGHVGSPAAGDVICHLDLFWTNVIFRNGLPVVLIDWELAAPSPRLLDVASAASYWAPLRIDEQALEWGLPLERRGERLRLLCDAYGLDAGERARFLDEHAAHRLRGYEQHRVWGGIERRPGWAEMWDSGSGDLILANLRWIDEHQGELKRFLA